MDKKAYTEVYYIINEMSEELRSKIPQKVIDNIKNKMDKEYDFLLEDDEWESIKLLEDTEKMLSVIYTDYIADDYERNLILNKEKILKEERIKKIKPKKIKEIFSDTKSKIDNKQTSTSLVLQQKWYEKIFNKLNKIFKK